MRGRLRLAALLVAVWLGGCLHAPDSALPTDGSDETDHLTPATPLAEVVQRRHVQPLDPDSPTPLLEQALAELAKTDPHGRFRGITYSLTTDNVLGPNWIVQTPDVWGRRSVDVGYFLLSCKGTCDADFRLPFCRSAADCPAPGATCGHLRAFDAQPDLVGRRLCLGPSDAVVDRFYRPIAEAQRAVDVTLLQPPADYRFLAAMRNAVTMLARSHRDVTLRFLVGQYPPNGTDAKALLAQLVRDAQHVPGARLTVYAAAMRSCTATPDCPSLSWNHAKIVAVDGKTAVVGGHNMYTTDYLLDHPVHDLTMQVSGGAARDAHHFADRLWDYVCDHAHDGAPVSTFVYRSGPNDIGPGCLERIELPPPATRPAGLAILASGRLGSGITKHFADQDDLARDLFFGAARHEILVAQQDVAFQLPGQATLYPEETLQAWAGFMLAGRGDVYLVLSNLGAEDPDGGNYSNGVPLADVAQKMLAVAQARSHLPRATLVDLLCAHFHLAPYRFGPDASWPDDKPIGNHSKFWMVDDRFFYIGSDNLYPVDLQEFGYIVDSRAAAAELRRKYWEKLWHWSRAAAISGADAPACMLRSPPAT